MRVVKEFTFGHCVICNLLCAADLWRLRKFNSVATQKTGIPVDFVGEKDGEKNHVNDAASSYVGPGQGVECEKSLEACVS